MGGSMYYRKGAFWDVSGRFGKPPGSARTLVFPGISRDFVTRREIDLSPFETGPIGHSGTSPAIDASDYRTPRSPREAASRRFLTLIAPTVQTKTKTANKSQSQTRR